ncbi:MAG TPA: hypothetical protein VLZ75_04175 [Chitinophagales bacterium]|nr:hypothetical protein [Chitinophagales bacterium]
MIYIIFLIIGILIGKFLIPNQLDVNVQVPDNVFKAMKEDIEDKIKFINSQSILINRLNDENIMLKEKLK